MKVLLLLAAALVAGCSSAPPINNTAARQEAAIEANRRGEAYVRHGELENAARSYREALRLSQSLEDPDGIAANAINLSIVRQRQGRFDEARASLGAILEQPNLRFAPSRLAEASLRHALLDLDQRRLASAEQWLSRSAQYCGERCALSAAIHNTGAQLALQAGRVGEAAAAARSAHDSARAAGDRAELANALRLLGIAALQSGDAGRARARLEEALAGDAEGARAYYARALAVAEADRDSIGAAEARAMLHAATGK